MNNLNASQWDWSLIRNFLAVAETGSLSKAATLLGLSQPTMSRQISEFETQVGMNLFKRSSQGLALTEQGLSILDNARAMQTAAEKLALNITGQAQSLAGDIRISANDIVGVYLLPRLLAEFQELHPEVQIEVDISNRAASLSKRDADLALRMFQPTQPDLVARRLPDLSLGFYAHQRYLDKNTIPTTQEYFYDHKIIGFDRDTSYIDQARHMGFDLTPKHFCLRTDSLLAGINLMRSGAGILATHTGLVGHIPGIVQVFKDIELPPLPFWIVCHHDVQTNLRFRTLMDFLVQKFSPDPYRYNLLLG